MQNCILSKVCQSSKFIRNLTRILIAFVFLKAKQRYHEHVNNNSAEKRVVDRILNQASTPNVSTMFLFHYSIYF